MRGRTGVRQLVPSAVATFIVTAVLAACASDGASSEPVSAPDAVTTTTAALAAPPSTSTSTTSTSTTTTSSSTTTTTIAIPDSPGPLDFDAAVVGLGRSVEGRPIVAERFGTPGGRRVLVIGVIHGDEDAGSAILDDLRSEPVPDGVELWVVDSMNPDGQAAQVRQNANGVDLNRNFPDSWGPIGVPGDSEYAGTGPASEPETQAIVNLVEQLRPDITIWYHQDLFVISPAKGREGRIRQRYAELTNWPMGGISGGTYTGIAATWARHALADQDGVAFIVELGPTLSPEDAALHADAIRTIGVEG
jgi:murein peptide amidase A